MSNFLRFKEDVQRQMANITQLQNTLLTVDLDKEKLWELYLNSFRPEDNPIFRERREHDCNCCKSFIKGIGNLVSIIDGNLVSVWDIETDSIYQPSVDAMRNYVMTMAIGEKLRPFVSNELGYGTDRSRELMENNQIHVWEHLHTTLPEHLRYKGQESLGSVIGNIFSGAEVFKRGLEEITFEALDVVIELSEDKTLYKGEEWISQLKAFKDLKAEWITLTPEQKTFMHFDLYRRTNTVVAKIRNTSIGQLLKDLSEGLKLEESVKKYEKIVAPSNYKRPKAIITEKMVKEAQNFMTENGYLDSLSRRYATLEDISVADVLFANRDSAKKMQGDVFGEMINSIPKTADKIKGQVQSIEIEEFVKNVLTEASELELLLENSHKNNLVSLIAPVNKGSKPMTKWQNGFTWSYAGNITDSTMKENVKLAGGCVEGVLRCSLQWNDVGYDPVDLDAHMVEKTSKRTYEIYFSNRGRVSPNGGKLDVDIIRPEPTRPAVENIIYQNSIADGSYDYTVHVFSGNSKHGFVAEIEVAGTVYEYECRRPLRPDEKINVATMEFKNGSLVSIKHHLVNSASKRAIWNVETQDFIPVSTVLYSPNHWDKEIDKIGNKHYFFMLKGCVNDEQPNGFYNEFLNSELSQGTNKRFLETLGSKMSVQDSENQLSGVGFSSTRRAEVVVRVDGKSTYRVSF